MGSVRPIGYHKPHHMLVSRLLAVTCDQAYAIGGEWIDAEVLGCHGARSHHATLVHKIVKYLPACQLLNGRKHQLEQQILMAVIVPELQQAAVMPMHSDAAICLDAKHLGLRGVKAVGPTVLRWLWCFWNAHTSNALRCNSMQPIPIGRLPWRG